MATLPYISSIAWQKHYVKSQIYRTDEEQNHHKCSIFKISCRAKKERFRFPKTSTESSQHLPLNQTSSNLHMGMLKRQMTIWILEMARNAGLTPWFTSQSYAKNVSIKLKMFLNISKQVNASTAIWPVRVSLTTLGTTPSLTRTFTYDARQQRIMHLLPHPSPSQ